MVKEMGWWPINFPGFDAPYKDNWQAFERAPNRQCAVLPGHAVICRCIDSAETALQICAEFFPDEEVPPRTAAVLQELFS
jgi:hypothetical protein